VAIRILFLIRSSLIIIILGNMYAIIEDFNIGRINALRMRMKRVKLRFFAIKKIVCGYYRSLRYFRRRQINRRAQCHYKRLGLKHYKILKILFVEYKDIRKKLDRYAGNPKEPIKEQ
jgi:hypothetical protein